MARTGYSRSPKFQKGALVQLPPSLAFPIPNIIPFQYNPATVSRSITPQLAMESGDGTQWYSSDGCSLLAPGSQPCPPQESITLEIELDANDDLEQGDSIAQTVGIAPRIAALENLLYVADDLLSSLGNLAASLTGGALPLTPAKVPVVLLVWGIGRLVPVRVTSYSIEEKLFLPSLYPIQATARLSLEVQSSNLFRDTGSFDFGAKIAMAAYDFFRVQQEALSLLNTVNAVKESVTLSLKI